MGSPNDLMRLKLWYSWDKTGIVLLKIKFKMMAANNMAKPENSPIVNIFFMILILIFWCRGRDSNPHAFRHKLLKLACLPISPPRHMCPRQDSNLQSQVPQTCALSGWTTGTKNCQSLGWLSLLKNYFFSYFINKVFFHFFVLWIFFKQI